LARTVFSLLVLVLTHDMLGLLLITLWLLLMLLLIV
jgi:hypothetical protein